MSHPIRPLAGWQSAVFLLNSRLGLLTAAPIGMPGGTPAGAPLIPRLRGYFAEFLDVVSPARLGLLDPSTCVGLRYGPPRHGRGAGFSRRPARASPPARRRAGTPRSRGDPHFQPGACAAGRVTGAAVRGGCRNVRLPSIGYAFRPGLRVRLTPGGRTWPGKPWICGGGDSHPPCRYSCLHGLPHALHPPSREGFAAHAALSYHPRP